jgi:hypothetical protein
MRAVNRRRLVVLALCSVVACDKKSEERVVALENRVADLEKKQTDAAASVAKLPEEQTRLATSVTALQETTQRQAETIATLQKDLAAAQEQLAKLPGDGSTTGTIAATSAGPIGIPECDEYVTKYMKCISDKVPASARKTMNEAMDQTIKAWKEAADGPARDGLATACKAAVDAAKEATKSMGCEW